MEERRRQLLEEADGYVASVAHHLVGSTSACLSRLWLWGPPLAADHRMSCAEP